MTPALDPARLDALRKLAEAATSGPWKQITRRDATSEICGDGMWFATVHWTVSGVQPGQDAAYIAAMSPDTTLALLAERAGLLARIAELEAAAK